MHRHLSLLTQPRTAVKVAFAATAVSTIAHNKDRILQFRPQLNSTVIEAISGAAGEVAQIALVYPLDTIKVRCQAAGVGSRQVVTDLWALTKGNWPAFLSALYAGALPAAALSILVGSVHYCCFCATRRALASLEADHNHTKRRKQAAAAAAAAGEEQYATAQHVIVSHGATGTHFLPIDEPLCAEDQQLLDTPPHAETSSSSSSSSSSSQGGTATSSQRAATAAAAAAGGAAEEEAESVQVAEGSMFVNCSAAVITAALTALVESPLELFRHNSQAGQIQGNFLAEMWRVLRKSGPRSLYYGLIPYCFESWPYDISELLVVGAAKDLRQRPAVRHMAPAAYDLMVGGLAGTVAVLVSMPFDVIKTYIQTHGALEGAAAASSGAVGISGSAGQFWSTGKALVARSGPKALFVGLAPRLAHQVPGAMVCWLVIESSHRLLTAHCLKRPPHHIQHQPSSSHTATTEA